MYKNIKNKNLDRIFLNDDRIARYIAVFVFSVGVVLATNLYKQSAGESASQIILSLPNYVGAIIILSETVWVGYKRSGLLYAVLFSYTVPVAFFLTIPVANYFHHSGEVSTATVLFLITSAVFVGAVTAIPYGILGYFSGFGIYTIKKRLIDGDIGFGSSDLFFIIATICGLVLFVFFAINFGMMFTGVGIT